VCAQNRDEFLKAESYRNSGAAFSAARDGISTFLQQSEKEWVYWIERTGKAAQNITLNASPIDVAPGPAPDALPRGLHESVDDER
jgi:hypothetical protein